MADAKPLILLVGGGSAGHTVPLLAVLQAITEQAGDGIRCAYVGTAKDLASGPVHDSPLVFGRYAIRSGKLNRFLTWRHVAELFGLVAGFWQAYRLLGRLHPQAIFSSGGAVTVPVARMAAWRGIPVFALEVNNELGLANRLVAATARRVFTAFPVERYRGVPTGKLQFVGRPVRPEFFHPTQVPVSVEGREVGSPVVTVIGGSQGSHRINELVSEGWPAYLAYGHLVHICGSADFASLQAEAAKLPEDERQRLHLVAFLNDSLPELFQRSAAVISRAGGTVVELAASGAAAILLPHGAGGNGHQAANARIFEAAGAAVVLDDEKITAAELADWAVHLEEKTDVELMRQSIRIFARQDAAQVMAKEILTSIGYGT